MTSSDEKPVILYDGDCKLCRKAVGLLKMRQKGSVFECIPSSGHPAGKYLEKYNIAPETTQRTLILIDQGRIFTKSAAVIRTLIKKGGLWKISAVLLMIPASLRDAVYDWVAERRNKI